MNKNKLLSGGEKILTGGGKWGERGREVGIGYPPVHPLPDALVTKPLQPKTLAEKFQLTGYRSDDIYLPVFGQSNLMKK